MQYLGSASPTNYVPTLSCTIMREIKVIEMNNLS